MSSNKPLIIGVCGGTSSGKTTLAREIYKSMIEKGKRALIISQDSFYRALTAEELEQASKNNYNFDHPNAIDFPLMYEKLREMAARVPGTSVEIPMYDFRTHRRMADHQRVEESDIIIIEGIFIFSDPSILSMMDIKLFVDVDADTRLLRRITRDINERGRDLKQVIDSYEKFVKPGFQAFIEPYKRKADLIIPNGGQNRIALQLVCPYLERRV